MKYLLSIALAISILLFPMRIYSQEIPLSLEDLTPGGKTFAKYRPQMPRQLRWYGDQLTYIKGDSLMIAPMDAKQKPEKLLTLSELNEYLKLEDKAKIGSMSYIGQLLPKSNEILVWTHTDGYVLNMVTKKRTAKYFLTKDMENFDFDAESKMLTYTKANNLYVQNADGEEKAVSNESKNDISFGNHVHRNEFGITKGTFWSPKGNLLAFYRMDESMVTDYPLVNMSPRVASLQNIKYPMAGMKSHHVTLGIYNTDTERTTYLKTGTPKEKYLTNIAWSLDEKYVYIAELNRGQDTCLLKSYDATTGNLLATLFTETHPKYVEPQNAVLFLKNDPTKFIWQSRRDGYNHLYLYNTEGKLLKQITSGNWEVISILGFDEKGENIFYSSTEVSPIEKHIYKLNLKNGKREQLSKEEGVHQASLSTSGKYISDSYTSQYNPGKVAVTEVKANKTYVFHEAKNPYRNVELPEIVLGLLKANDGETDLYYRMVKPLNFDPANKYPVIVYVYGGPHMQMVDNSWMLQARGWDIYMAEKGYIVFTLDNRGTPNRGADFENAIHRQLGVKETEDQMVGVNYLKSLPYVDTNRFGVHGWSFGGFMTLNLMLRHPETFKVGVAGGPVTDWKYYEIMYGERYMDSPQENPEGYKQSSMVERAGDLQGRLLMIHGDQDPTVVMQQTSQFMKASIDKRTHPDLFIYPGHGHNVMGKDRVHLQEHITRYFDDFLK